MMYYLAHIPLATPSPAFDPNSATPTWVGFLATFLVAGATILLMLDLTRRVRRVRYRGEIREKLEAERLAEEAERLANGEDPKPS
ncbi:MAG TPA: hypothetical protein VIQ26_07260 [Microbacteriaceae bacterium]